MVWSKQHDLLLCREVLLLNPYKYIKGSTQRSSSWEKIAESLNTIKTPTFQVDKRSVRDHVGVLINRLKKKTRAEEKASGIAPPEPSELESMLEEIIELSESSDQHQKEATEEKEEKDAKDKENAQDIRSKAMESLSQTKKRKAGKDCDKEKKKRRGGSDTLEYLAEKSEKDRELKVQQMNMEKAQHEVQMAYLKMMMQQQQDQTKALVGLLSNFMDKSK